MNQIILRYKNYLLFLVSLLIIGISSCVPKNGTNQNVDRFDRKAMLTFWAEDIIIPAYDSYANSTINLKDAADQFNTDPSLDNLKKMRSAWETAYLAWQGVSMFEIGKAESSKIRSYTNIFPTNVDLIKSNINATTYNLELPSNYAAQGFPALDFLLFGIGSDDVSILDSLTKSSHRQYFTDIVDRIYNLAQELDQDWDLYKEVFIQNDGSSATASVDKLINDYLFYYERFLRAGKVGIPAGVFSANILPQSTEAFYNGTLSKALLIESIHRFKDFFNGISFKDTSAGTSIYSYIDEVTKEGNNTTLSADINDQFESILQKAELLENNLSQQIQKDNTKMLALYDELQKLVVLLKVDAMQALNIQIDFVDADGD